MSRSTGVKALYGGTVPMLIMVAVLVSWGDDDFKKRQDTASRVVAARKARTEAIQSLFSKAEVSYPPRRMLLRAFKEEALIELWAAGAKGPLKRVQTYPVCANSGDLGPKRRQGDLQVPEGAYHVDRFNAWSSYHLSLGINYPNASDRILGRKGAPKAKLGGDIFIHGDCVTIGCLPIEDEPIEELYLIALDTHLDGRRVHVHVFPRRMDDAGMAALKARAAGDAELWNFWQNLRPIYRQFEADKLIPKVTVGKDGMYRVGKP